MSIDDFARCTPAEFWSVSEQWRKRVEAVERGEWERSRWQALCILQPWSKKQLKAEDVCVFPWEQKQETPPERQLSAEEQRARYEAAKRRYGIG